MYFTFTPSSFSLPSAPHREGSVGGHVLHVHPVQLQPAVSPHLVVVVPVPLGEAPLLADEDLLAARELELGAPQSLDAFSLELVMAPNRYEYLTNLNPGSCAMSLAKSSSHPSLQPVSPSTRQHLVDAQHHEGVHADPDVELVLAAVLHEVLVAADAGSLQGLAGQLLQLIGHQVNGERELVDSSPLPAKVKDPDLWVRNSTVEPALGVGLVLAVAIALSWSPSHDSLVEVNQASISL